MAAKTAANPSKRTSKRKVASSRAGAARAAKVKPRITHPDRVYWVDVGVTKQDLLDYYRTVWDWMAPYVVGRPLALVRCPEGTAGQCFFQKHASAGLVPENLHIVTDSKGRQIIAIEDTQGLVSLVQAGVLELHVRGARIDRLDVCDRIVFDLDPGEGIGWPEITACANELRDRLAALDLESFVKLSGGKGVHVVVPIDGADWEDTKTFTEAIAMAMAADTPDRYVAKMTKSLRRGKIFIDYLRNSLEQTSVAAYSTRARPGAPISAPVTWQELGNVETANHYTVLNIRERLASTPGDPWRQMDRVHQRLPQAGAVRRRA